MNSFFDSALKAFGKILWSIFLYAFSSIFFMLLAISFMSGKFPPPMKETWGQLQEAKKNFAKVMEMQKKIGIGGNSNSAAKGSEADAPGSGANLAELAKLDGLAKLKDHNRELEEAFAAGGNEYSNIGTNTQPSAQQAAATAEQAQEMKRLRFEVDVLKGQLYQARQDIETMKRTLYPTAKPPQVAAQQVPQQKANYATTGTTPATTVTPVQNKAPANYNNIQPTSAKK